jgi:predicted Zn-dependent protease
MNRRILTALFLLAGLIAFPGCTTVPETGRSQLVVVPSSVAAQSGAAAFLQIKEKEKVTAEPVVNARITRIGRRIAAAVGRDLPDANWEFVVFDSPQLNAFALPGGKVGFYTGLINLAGSDDEIAAVMGHEIAHVTSRHGAERQSQAMLVGGLGALLNAGTQENKNRDLFQLAYVGVSALGTLAYSREHETEADAVGLRFAARAGYDPRAAISIWQKMAAKNSGPAQPKWLSTHPPTAERIARLQQLAPTLLPLYEQAKAGMAP